MSAPNVSFEGTCLPDLRLSTVCQVTCLWAILGGPFHCQWSGSLQVPWEPGADLGYFFDAARVHTTNTGGVVGRFQDSKKRGFKDITGFT